MDETKGTPLLMLPLFLLPLISGLASYFELHDLLLVAYFVVGLTAFFALRDESTPDLFFIVLIWSISLSLIVSSTLTSTTLMGWDIQDEYRTSMQVLTLHRWNIAGSGLYNSVLSVNLLIPMVTITSGLNLLAVYQLLLPITWSIAPIILYKTYRTILQKRAAFLATFLLMSFPTFYGEMLEVGRQEVAEIILLGLILVLLARRKETRTLSAVLAALLFGAGFVAAHYSLAFIFMFFFLFSFVMPRILPHKVAPLSHLNMLLTLFIAMLALYTFAAGGVAISSLGAAISNTLTGTFAGFLSPASRPSQVLLAVGVQAGLPGPLHIFNRITQYLVQACIVLGFVAFAIKKPKTLAEMQMVPLMTGALLFLGASVALPSLANALIITRVYHISLLILAPCFIIGVEKICSIAKKVESTKWKTYQFGHQLPKTPRIQRRWILAAAILSCYFLFVGGWVWSVTLDYPTSTILDLQRLRDSTNPSWIAAYDQSYLEPQDAAAAAWLNTVRSMNDPVCADSVTSQLVLTSYGGVPRLGPGASIDLTYCPGQSYVFLSQYNTVGMTVYSYGSNGAASSQYTLSTYQPRIEDINRIFSDGAAVYS